MEEIIGIVFRGFGRFFVWFIFEIAIEMGFYLVGYPIVKIFTLGKYPKSPFWNKSKSDDYEEEDYSEWYVSLIGFIISAAFLLFFFRHYIFDWYRDFSE